MKILGKSKIAEHNKTTVVQQVATLLNISKGDEVAYLLDDDGRIIIANTKDLEMTISLKQK